MEDVMTRHFNGFAGRALTAAGLSDAFSLTVATSGATRLSLGQPENAALATSANANKIETSGLRVFSAQCTAVRPTARRLVAVRFLDEPFTAGLGSVR